MAINPRQSAVDPPSDDKRWRIVQAAMRRNGFRRDALIETLHATKPVDRPTSAAEVAESLKRWCAGSECSSSYILM